uniref:Uncharacterized protein n=1 Tax=Pararge aegeria TaxID=116150 RepID=S4P3E8_9NEOP
MPFRVFGRLRCTSTAIRQQGLRSPPISMNIHSLFRKIKAETNTSENRHSRSFRKHNVASTKTANNVSQSTVL